MHRFKGALLLGLALGACSSQESTSLSSRNNTPAIPCRDLATCGEGQRCDDGFCVPDTTCPTAIAPRVIFDGTGQTGPVWRVVSLQGHDFVHLNTIYAVDEEDPNKTQERFFELNTGQHSSWNHAPGEGSLWELSGQIFGTSNIWSSGIHTAYTGLQREGNAWVHNAEHVFPPEYPWFVPLQSGAGLWFLFNENKSTFWDPKTGETSPEISFDGRSFWHIFTVDKEEVAVTRSTSFSHGMASVSYFQRPMQQGAEDTFLFADELPEPSSSILFQAKGRWYAAHDCGPNGEPGVFAFYRQSGTSFELLGTTTELSFLNAVLDELTERSGLPSGDLWGSSCGFGYCRVLRLRLEPFGVEEVGMVEIDSGSLVRVAKTKALACDSVDLLLGTFSGTLQDAKPAQLLHARIVR